MGGSVNGAPDPYFLFLADIHLNSHKADTPHKDDTGTNLWAAAMARLNTLMDSPNPPKFIIYTGDLTAHEYQNTGPSISLQDRHDNSAIILADLRSLADTIPLFYAPGNNDGFGGDYYAFTNNQDSSVFDLDTTLNYPAPNAQMVSAPHLDNGYYSARPVPGSGLRIIALNSVILGHKHHGSLATDYWAEGNTMLTWLGTELTDVKKKKEKAYIMMHIPPGIDAFGGAGSYTWDTKESNLWQTTFLNLIDSFQQEISGVFYGHTHMDELRQLASPSDPSTINEIAISSPGISPIFGQNPGFKTVIYDSKTFELQDFTTYYTNRTSTVWGKDSLLFSTVYGCAGQSILDCLKGRSVNSVATDMVKTYKAGKKPDKSVSYVAAAVLVD